MNKIVKYEERSYSELPLRQKIYVDWVAGGGVVFTEDGQIQSTTSQEVADKLGVSRQALHKYRKAPHFWDIVKERRTELYGQLPMSLIYRSMMGKAIKGDVAAAKLMMQQARVLEAEKQDVSVQGVVGVTVINYGAAEKELGPGEKPQIEEVPVPGYITSHTPETSSDTSYAEPANSGQPDTTSAAAPTEGTVVQTFSPTSSLTSGPDR